jgi:hypothetical protein
MDTMRDNRLRKTSTKEVNDDDQTPINVPIISSDSDDEIHVLYPAEHSETETVEDFATTSDEESEASTSANSEVEEPPLPRRSGRNRRPPAWLRSGDYINMAQRVSTAHTNLHHQRKLVTHVYLSILKYQTKMFRDLMSHLLGGTMLH